MANAATQSNEITTEWASEEYRKKILDSIRSCANVNRKKESLRQYEVFNDRFHSFVFDYISSQMTVETAKEMPIISCVNLAKKIVATEASIYKNAPARTFQGANENDDSILKKVYSDSRLNSTMKKANRYFRLQQQTWVQPIIEDGKITTRVLFPHHIDVVKNKKNPNKADAIIISSFDDSSVNLDGKSDEKVIRESERYQVEAADVTFIMDGNGQIIGDIDVNELGEISIVEVSDAKDYEYFVRQGQTLTDFTIQFNAGLSDIQHICRLQGFAIWVLKSPQNETPKQIRIGPNIVIHLPTDPNNPSNNSDLTPVTPASNIDGTLKANVNLLAMFLSSRGVDTSTISAELNASKTYNSGLDRLLAMIDEFEASQDDIEEFQQAEFDLFRLKVKMLETYSKTDVLHKDYHVSASIQSVTLGLKYAEPQAVKTDTEKLDYADKRVEMGIWSPIDAVMYIDGVSEEEAKKQIEKVKAQKVEEKPELEDDSKESEPLNG